MQQRVSTINTPWTGDEILTWVLGAPVRILLIIILAVLVRWLLHRGIRTVVSAAMDKAEANHANRITRRASKALREATGVSLERSRQRAATLGSLLRSVTTVVISAIAILMVMAELGLPLQPLLASAGITGIALGFGAQSLVKDYLAGIFMIIEDQYGVGDYIDAGEAIGEVEEVSLRVTRLRDAQGVVWFVRNGEIIRIGNNSQGWATAAIDLQAAPDEDVSTVLGIVRRECQALHEDPTWGAKLLEAPTVAGVESVTGTAMTVRVFAKCRPGQQWAVPRALRERVKLTFDAEGVRGPRATFDHGPG